MLRRSIEANAHRFGRRMTWPQVAAKYEDAFVAGLQSRPTAVSLDERHFVCADAMKLTRLFATSERFVN
jgi:hypothetical protein